MPTPSASTSAYCQARAKLEQDCLESILSHTAEGLQQRGRSQWWKQRRVVVVDGTGVSMPDTQANQAIWPQQAIQKPGCGFPQARVCACFCLQTGALLSYRTGNRKQQELPLLRQQMETFEPGDIFLGDKGFLQLLAMSGSSSRVGLTRYSLWHAAHRSRPHQPLKF
ncbi:MAG: transposase [Candidatus Sedimenticola sp. (ex Thyasira tokunagai)]